MSLTVKPANAFKYYIELLRWQYNLQLFVCLKFYNNFNNYWSYTYDYEQPLHGNDFTFT